MTKEELTIQNEQLKQVIEEVEDLLAKTFKSMQGRWWQLPSVIYTRLKKAQNKTLKVMKEIESV